SVRLPLVPCLHCISARKFASLNNSNTHLIRRTNFAFHTHPARIQQTSLARRNGALRPRIHHHSSAHSRRVGKPPPLAAHSRRRSKHSSQALSHEHSFQRLWIRPVRDQRHASAVHRNLCRLNLGGHSTASGLRSCSRRS